MASSRHAATRQVARRKHNTHGTTSDSSEQSARDWHDDDDIYRHRARYLLVLEHRISKYEISKFECVCLSYFWACFALHPPGIPVFVLQRLNENFDISNVEIVHIDLCFFCLSASYIYSIYMSKSILIRYPILPLTVRTQG